MFILTMVHLGELCGIAKLNVPVSRSPEEALGSRSLSRPAVDVVTAVSNLARIEPQLVVVARAGFHAVRTCEELVFPWKTHPQIAARIDHRRVPARRSDHRLPSAGRLGTPRPVPAEDRRGAGPRGLQAQEGRGHPAPGRAAESIDLIATRLARTLERVTETLEPVIASRTVSRGFRDAQEAITLFFRTAVGEPESYDRIEMAGEPPLDLRFRSRRASAD